LLSDFHVFLLKWKSYYQALDSHSKPKCGSATLLLSKYDDITEELKSFIGIYLCRNKTRRNWLENECGIIFLQNSQQRQLLLQFESKGSKKESEMNLSNFPEGIFLLDLEWKVEEMSVKEKKSCLICLESVTSRVIRGDILVCDHIFCLECISRWSTIQNKCPACKRIFTEIRTHEKLSSSKKRKFERIFPVSPNSILLTPDSPTASPSPTLATDPQLLSADYWHRFVSNESVMANYLFRLFGEESVNLDPEAYRPMFFRHILSHLGIAPPSSLSLELYSQQLEDHLDDTTTTNTEIITTSH
jgi:hypothetical protein